jgi:hypothetical protein
MRSVGQTHLNDPFAPTAAIGAGVLRKLGGPVVFGAPVVFGGPVEFGAPMVFGGPVEFGALTALDGFGAFDELVTADSESGRGLLTCGAGVLRELGGMGDPAVAGAGAGLGAACGATRWDGGSLPGPNTKTWPTEMR